MAYFKFFVPNLGTSPINNFDILEFDTKASVHYGKIRATLEQKENVIGGLDMLNSRSRFIMRYDACK